VEERLTEAMELERVARAGWRRSPATRGGIGTPVSRSLGADELDTDDRALFDALRTLRRELADEEKVPAYIVFGDRVLLEMVARKPETHAELLQVPGVGQAKLEKYGDYFLEAIINHSS
jgi:ATP-dependent DNA helicase RecQ